MKNIYDNNYIIYNNSYDEIRINYYDSKFYLIKWPKNYSELIDIIEKTLKINVKKDKIKCTFIKINESDLNVNEYNFTKELTNKEKESIIEIYVSIHDINNSNILNNTYNKYEVKIELINEQSLKSLKIFQGMEEYKIYFHLKNTGNQPLPFDSKIKTIENIKLKEYKKKFEINDINDEHILNTEPLKITDMLDPNQVKTYCCLILKNKKYKNTGKYYIFLNLVSSKLKIVSFIEPIFIDIVNNSNPFY